VLIFDWEIPRGFGEITVYTFGISYFNMGEVENFEMEPEVRGTSGWVPFCSPSCADYFVQKPEVNRLRNDRDIAV